MRSKSVALGVAVLALALGATACSGAATGSATTHQAGPAGRPNALPASGTVTVKYGNKVVCVMTVKAGKGTCKVNTAKYPPGALKFVASYSGGAGFKSSTASTTLQLKRATSTTKLTLSAARVAYGHEQAERLTVRVAPQYTGTPPGKVTVSAGRTVVCVITLASGGGSCTLTASKLTAGSYHLVARYAGSASFGPSASAGQSLVVTG